LQRYLRSFVNYKQDDWDLHLTGAEFAYNSHISTTTQLSPFAVTDGHQPCTPALFLKPAVAKLSPIPRTTAFVKALAEDVVLAKKIVPDVAPGVTTPNPLPAVAHDNILKAQTRLTKNANKH